MASSQNLLDPIGDHKMVPDAHLALPLTDAVLIATIAQRHQASVLTVDITNFQT